jgi:hypothetical protein
MDRERVARELLLAARELVSREQRWSWMSDETSWSLTWDPRWNYVLYDYNYHPDIPDDPTQKLTFEEATRVWRQSQGDQEDYSSSREVPGFTLGVPEEKPPPKPRVQKSITVDDSVSRSLFGMTKRNGAWASERQMEFFERLFKRGDRLSPQEKRWVEKMDWGVIQTPPFGKDGFQAVMLYYVDADGVRLKMMRWQAGRRSGLKKKWERR